MAVFYGVFNLLHPEFAGESAIGFKQHLIDQKNTLPQDIEKEVATYKKQYTLKIVSGAIFGYLIMGAVFTLPMAFIVLARKKK
jgi:hypothetical protein